MSKLHTVGIFVLIASLIVYAFLFTTNGLLKDWFGYTDETPSFSKFGVLFSTIANYSIFYIDYEWLLLDDQVPRSGPDRHGQMVINDKNPFMYSFPYYAFHGPKSKFSIEAESDWKVNATRLYYGSSLVGEVTVLYICRSSQASAAPLVVNYHVLINSVNGPRTLRTWVSNPHPSATHQENITFMSYLADSTSEDGSEQTAIFIGIIKEVDYIDGYQCRRNQQRLRRVRFVPLVRGILGGCSNPADFAAIKPTARLSQEWMHTDTEGHVVFWVVCSNFFRILRISFEIPESYWHSDGGAEFPENGLNASDPDLFPVVRRPEQISFADWMTGVNDKVSVAQSVYTVQGRESIFTSIYVANNTETGPSLKVCDAYNPDLWSISLSKLKNWRCRSFLLKATEVPTGIKVASDMKSVILTFHLRGIARLQLTPMGCIICGNPHFHHSTETITDRLDGIVGDPYIPLMDPESCAFDIDGDLMYFIDGTDGYIRWNRVYSGGDIISPAEILWQHVGLRKAPRSVSRSAHLDRLVVADWTGRQIHALTRITSNYSIVLTPLVNTPGNPFDLDATVDGDKVMWSEPIQNRMCRAIWTPDSPSGMAHNITSWIYGRTIAGVTYSTYFQRAFAASPRAGEILSVHHDDITEAPITHFSCRHFDVTEPRHSLRPMYLAVDDNYGSLYFNVLPAPNISAYDLTDPEFYTKQEEGVWYRPPEKNLTATKYGYNLASTIWLMKKRPFSTSLLYPPKPFYTNPKTLILSITRNDDWLVFVEMPLDVNSNFSAKIGRLPLLSTTDETFSLNWRVRTPEDVSSLLDWTSATPNTVYAPIGVTNLWEHTPIEPESTLVEASVFGWVALVLLFTNMACAAIYHTCRRDRCALALVPA